MRNDSSQASLISISRSTVCEICSNQWYVCTWCCAVQICRNLRAWGWLFNAQQVRIFPHEESARICIGGLATFQLTPNTICWHSDFLNRSFPTLPGLWYKFACKDSSVYGICTITYTHRRSAKIVVTGVLCFKGMDVWYVWYELDMSHRQGSVVIGHDSPTWLHDDAQNGVFYIKFSAWNDSGSLASLQGNLVWGGGGVHSAFSWHSTAQRTASTFRLNADFPASQMCTLAANM